jgi:hypothetical protein
MDMSGQPHAQATLCPRKELQYPLKRRLSGATDGLDIEAKRKIPPCQELNPDHLARSLVTVLTKLPWLY